MESGFGPAEVDDRGEETAAAFVARLRALDQQAWAELYDRHHTQIWRYANARTGSRDAADDIAAEVFTAALASIHRYRYTGRPILAWLYRIARNTASKQTRRRRREIPAGNAEPSGGAPDDRLDSMVLADALQHLTDDQREVVVLRFYVGYSTREIALVMGKREPAVYSLEVRAIAALRRALTSGAGDLPSQANKNSPITGIDRVR